MTRKIDKRACRKFALPELEFNLNEGVLHVESCPYIIRTAVRNIAGQRILMHKMRSCLRVEYSVPSIRPPLSFLKRYNRT